MCWFQQKRFCNTSFIHIVKTVFNILVQWMHSVRNSVLVCILVWYVKAVIGPITGETPKKNLQMLPYMIKQQPKLFRNRCGYMKS